MVRFIKILLFQNSFFFQKIMSPPSSSGKPPAVVSEMTRTRTQLEYERQEKYRQQQQQQMTHSSFINNPLLRANNNQSTTPQTLTTTNSASLFSHAPYDSTYEKVTSIRKQIEDIQKASSVIEELYTEDAMAGKAGPSRGTRLRVTSPFPPSL